MLQKPLALAMPFAEEMPSAFRSMLMRIRSAQLLASLLLPLRMQGESKEADHEWEEPN